jgi:hypothetical protein
MDYIPTVSPSTYYGIESGSGDFWEEVIIGPLFVSKSLPIIITNV